MYSQGPGELGEGSATVPLAVTETPGAGAQRSLDFIKHLQQTL